MAPENSPPSLIQLPTFIFFFFTVLPRTHSRDHSPPYGDCRSSFECGILKEISYPFWGNQHSHCGRQGFELQCQPHEYPVINMENQTFIVLEIEQNSQWMKLARSDIWNGSCPLLDTQLNHPPFSFSATGIRNLSIFHSCQVVSTISEQAYNFSCTNKNGSIGYDYVLWEAFTGPAKLCYLKFTVPVLITAYDQLVYRSLTLKEALNEGFIAVYHFEEEEFCRKCRTSRGTCVRSMNATQVLCFCDNGRLQKTPCLKHGYWFASGVAFACLMIVVYKTTRMMKSKTMKDPNVETYIKKYGSLAPKRYQCSDIKKITNSFREKLGEGGFCSVYKGKLDDGRPVAVKVLKTDIRKGNGEEFINEVISISRTSHVNIVSLLGYCYTTNKKALMFEFMPNDSLEKFIHNENITIEGRLAWGKLHEIAIGIARGLEYLHRGCNTRILHLDVKPHNVLLDENFCPKISDFGLAKLCPKESVISVLDARGKIGYIAPELFSRNFGRVSHKADVYSFGMMVLEIVGGRKNIDEFAKDSSELYYPHWVYDHI
ncbi:hypothetical protein PVK06_030568 [Gossypium arboreum]|uniref:non-specific serine/threonine protein kinase n=1 Tax=Gossypium arboreum TaxID=29729 RepID=A0ABR0NNW9_GOSAR|nr:hypothetical protein PVK06_030568 [Gossypium arboreum]